MTAPALQVYINGTTNNPVNADNFNTFQQTCDTFADLRAFIGVPGVQVFARGNAAVNDNFQGNFYWSSTATAADDNTDVIRPTGLTVGAWLRITVLGSSILGVFASPPPLGNTTPNLVYSSGGALNGTIGATAPNTGAFTALTSPSLEMNPAGTSRLWSYVPADTALEYKVAGTKMLTVSDIGRTTGKFFQTDNLGQALGAGGAFANFGAFTGPISGVKTSGSNALVYIAGVDTLASTAGGLSGLRLDLTQGGTGAAGSRVGVYINQIHHGNLTAKSLGYGNQIGGLWSYVTIDGNFGGTAGNGNSYGSAWGGIASIQLTAGATYMTGISGLEVNMGVDTGASAVYVTGAAVVLGTHRQATSYLDSFLSVGATVDRSRVGLGNLIGLGSATGYWGLDATGDVMQLIPSNATLAGGPLPYTARNGINLTGITFSGSPFLSTGFAVSPAGVITASALANGGTTARTLGSMAADVLNIRNYGAVPDGVTDSTAAIQSALNSVGSTQQTVYFPKGIYAISGTLYIKSGTTLNGNGASLLALASWTSAPYSMIQNPNRTIGTKTDRDITINGLKFDYTALQVVGGGGNYAIFMLAATNVKVDRCNFYYGADATAFINCDDSSVTNCAAYYNINCPYDMWGGCTNMRIENNYAESSTASEAVNFNGWAGTGSVAALTSSGCIIDGNVFNMAGGVAGKYNTINLDTLATNCKVRNVVVSNNILTGGIVSGRGDVAAVKVSGNIIDTPPSTYAAIQFYTDGTTDPANIDVVGNKILSPSTTAAGGIAVIYVAANGYMIDGNTITGGTYTSPNLSTSTFAGTLGVNDFSAGVSGATTASSASTFGVAGALIRKAATADQSADVYVATAAGSRTIPNGCSWECLTPAATIATFATTMPAAPIDKQEVWISTTQTITTWTLSANAGQTINGAPTTLLANTSVMFRYNLATTAWFRMV